MGTVHKHLNSRLAAAKERERQLANRQKINSNQEGVSARERRTAGGFSAGFDGEIARGRRVDAAGRNGGAIAVVWAA